MHICVCVHACGHTRLSVCVRVHVCVCACVHVCVSVCVCSQFCSLQRQIERCIKDKNTEKGIGIHEVIQPATSEVWVSGCEILPFFFFS